MTAPILLSTVGSHGDLFPVIAVARALEELGQPARLALSPEDALIARAHGLDAFDFGPSQTELLDRLGLDPDGLARQIFRNPSPILTRGTYPMLADLAQRLIPEAQKARAVSATLLAMAAPLAAEVTRTPFIPLLLQPMLLRSALDPPRIPGFSPPMAAKPRSQATRTWNRAWLRVIDAEFSRRHARDQSRTRRDLGLPPTRAVPLFGHAAEPIAQLGLWDPAFSKAPPDRPVTLTGFPKPPGTPLPQDLLNFLNAGPAPFVVSLGSVSHNLGGPAFYSDCCALARSAGLRAVFLAGPSATPNAPDLFTLPAASHDALFPRAAAVLHHGGIGTTGAACRAGIPQLIMPLGADQPDNVARVERAGIGRRIRRPSEAAADLAAILSPETRDRARDIAERLIPDGAATAARALLQAVEGGHSPL
ncbi:nucleotide disphospho-sugar-binding domain-containing protein [Palleronia abyssalis]|uniref:Glycosyltransferase GtfC n=1 Tax=Palleronia abyssalis TaxID=1501240 RepID=A0A2R8BUC9_9RHOB|nr:nucleotide disphospho-sugar-binding domain-containing protein [Palleronia abyssalis]SPJ23735.1 Glycosyltransferase GtfC [Palleronia abyssalis]